MSLRARLVASSGLLVLTAVAASTWTVVVLGRLGDTTGAMIRDTDAASAATSALAGAIEREDDALLVSLAQAERGRTVLGDARARTQEARAELRGLLAAEAQEESALEIDRHLAAYRAAVDALLADPGSEPLVRYHSGVNPALRQMVAEIARVREQHFATLHRAAELAHDEVSRTHRVVVAISLVALAVSLVLMGLRLAEFRRTNLEEVLRAKRTLEAMMSALPDAVLLVGADGAVVSTNPAARALFGALGRPPPEKVEDLSVLGIAGREGAVTPADIASALKVELGGELRRYTVRVVPVALEPSASILVISDVTELVRLDEMRLELVAVASHELRTPVTTLRMCLSMLRERAAGLDPALREYVSTAVSGVDQLAETVDELLDLSQIEAGRLELHTEPVDAGKLAELSVIRARPRAAELGLALDLEIDPDLPTIAGDRARLRLVFDNLIDNAFKYTPRGGRIAIAASREDGSVKVAVTDSGVGIPDELRPRVFEKFFRVEHHRARAEVAAKGTGIGLYLCREIIRLHGGTIACERGPGGLGTRIAFTLRALAEAAPVLERAG